MKDLNTEVLENKFILFYRNNKNLYDTKSGNIESLETLYRDLSDLYAEEKTEPELILFNGNLFYYNMPLFHQCFDNGRFDEHELIELCKKDLEDVINQKQQV